MLLVRPPTARGARAAGTRATTRWGAAELLEHAIDHQWDGRGEAPIVRLLAPHLPPGRQAKRLVAGWLDFAMVAIARCLVLGAVLALTGDIERTEAAGSNLVTELSCECGPFTCSRSKAVALSHIVLSAQTLPSTKRCWTKRGLSWSCFMVRSLPAAAKAQYQSNTQCFGSPGTVLQPPLKQECRLPSTVPGENELSSALEEAAKLIQQNTRKMRFTPRIATVCTVAAVGCLRVCDCSSLVLLSAISNDADLPYAGRHRCSSMLRGHE